MTEAISRFGGKLHRHFIRNTSAVFFINFILRLRDMARYWSKIANLIYPTCIWRLWWCDPIRISQSVKKLQLIVWWSTQCFYTIQARDGQTDRRADERTIRHNWSA